MTSFGMVATLDCSTMRSPISGGNRQEPVEYLTGLKCTPLDPIPLSDSAIVSPKLKRGLRLLQTFIDGQHDIIPGDKLVVGSVEYPISTVNDWSDFLHIYVEAK